MGQPLGPPIRGTRGRDPSRRGASLSGPPVVTSGGGVSVATRAALPGSARLVGRVLAQPNHAGTMLGSLIAVRALVDLGRFRRLSDNGLVPVHVVVGRGGGGAASSLLSSASTVPVPIADTGGDASSLDSPVPTAGDSGATMSLPRRPEARLCRCGQGRAPRARAAGSPLGEPRLPRSRGPRAP